MYILENVSCTYCVVVDHSPYITSTLVSIQCAAVEGLYVKADDATDTTVQ